MRRFLHLFWIVILYSCANIVAPTGGPKDEIGPVLTESEPANYKVGFKQKKVILTFNEYIGLKDEGEILISPRLEARPTFKLKGKELEIEMPDSLGLNTTYTINFAKSLVDITEGNAAKNLSYVFSTGDFLDSLSLTGRVVDALDQKPSADFLIGLYPNNSSLETSKPLYLTYTDNMGRFSINNIRKGGFELLAFDDKNKDLLHSPNEAIAFLNESIELLDSLPDLKMRSFRPISRRVISETHLIDSNTVSIKTSFPLFKPKVYSSDSIELFLEEVSLDSALVYFEKRDSDSLKFYFSQEDIMDTIYLEYENDGASTDSLFFNPKESRILNDSVYLLKLNSWWTLSDTQKIRLVLDKHDTVSLGHIKSKGSFVEVVIPITSLTEYSLQFADSSLMSINGKSNQYTVFDFKTRNFNEFGTLILDSTAVYKSKSFILEILKRDKVVYREKDWQTNKLLISRLEAGEYNLRFIVDRNQNGIFDSGDFSTKTQAEQVIHYKSTIVIKSNWELELSPAVLLGNLDGAD